MAIYISNCNDTLKLQLSVFCFIFLWFMHTFSSSPLIGIISIDWKYRKKPAILHVPLACLQQIFNQ